MYFMTIRTIIFDFGGVLVKAPNLGWINRWKHFLRFGDDPEIMAILTNPNESQMVKDMCLGELPEQKIWELIAEKFRLKPKALQRLRHGVFSKRNLNKPLLRFMADLSADYQLAILSNAGNQARSLMQDHYHLDRYVEEIIISAEEGVIKPDHKIFQIAADRLQVPPKDVIFLDDYLNNVLSAREFGMTAVQFINNHQAITTIQDYLEEGG